MKGDIKQFRIKGKIHGSTTDYCGKLILTAEHSCDATLLAALAWALFPLSNDQKPTRAELLKLLLAHSPINTIEARGIRDGLGIPNPTR